MRRTALIGLYVLLVAGLCFAAIGSDGSVVVGAPAAGEDVISESAAPPADTGLTEGVRQETVGLADVEMALFQLTNADRARAGLPPVTFAPELLDIARQRASAQNANQALNHFDGAGDLAFVRLIADRGLSYRLIGENLARLTRAEGVDPERAEALLMSDPAHRANILDPTYDRLAVGSATDGAGQLVLVQIFGASMTP
jgi:uncharacterized protein YkwD